MFELHVYYFAVSCPHVPSSRHIHRTPPSKNDLPTVTMSPLPAVQWAGSRDGGSICDDHVSVRAHVCEGVSGTVSALDDVPENITSRCSRTIGNG